MSAQEKTHLAKLFRAWRDRYNSLDEFAKDHDMNKDAARRVIDKGRLYHDRGF